MNPLRNRRESHRDWPSPYIRGALSPMAVYVTTLPSISNGSRIRTNRSSSAIVNCDELYMGTSMMKSWHNTSVCFQLILFFMYRSNLPLSMPYELDCSLGWTIPIMEDLAFFWQNIPTHLLDNTKCQSNGYARPRNLALTENWHQEELAAFENIISELAITTARPVIRRQMGSFMIFPSINPYTELPVVSILNMIWYASDTVLFNAISNHQPKRDKSVI